MALADIKQRVQHHCTTNVVQQIMLERVAMAKEYVSRLLILNTGSVAKFQ